MPSISITGLAEHILDVPSAYPGQHNYSQGRTDPDLLPVDPKRQLLLVWDAMCDWIRAQLERGQGVTAKGFGSFTFERSTKQLPPVVRELGHVGKEIESLTPRFIMSPELAVEVSRHPTTNMLDKNYTNCSIYQTKNMKFLNPVPIGAACYMETPLVVSALNAFFRAIVELTRNNYDLDLDFKFCVVRISNRRLSYKFSPLIQQASAKFTMNRRPVPVKDSWMLHKGEEAMYSFIQGPPNYEGMSKDASLKTLPAVSERLAQMMRQRVDDLSQVSSLRISN